VVPVVVVLQCAAVKTNRVPFNCLIDPATKDVIGVARKEMGVSEGGAIDVWAAFYRVARGIGTPEIQEAARNLQRLLKKNRPKAKKRGTR
jgi:hypothetical protein